MNPATHARSRREVRLIVADAAGGVAARECFVGGLSGLMQALEPGDALVLNDAATLPASFVANVRSRSGEVRCEVRLLEAPDNDGIVHAIVLGSGDHRERTERRGPPPRIEVGDGIVLGQASRAEVTALLEDRLQLTFEQRGAALWTALLRDGRPIQYSHVPAPLALYDVQTVYAGASVAVEMPSAGYGLTWSVLGALRAKGVELHAVTHAAGISSSGHARLDAQLPLPERSTLRATVAASLNAVRRRGGRVIAVGTSVVRALESFADARDQLHAGTQVTALRIHPGYRLRVVDGLLTGMHAPGESHHELLQAFASHATLSAIFAEAADRGFLAHEYGDVLLLAARSHNRGESAKPRELVA